MARRGVLGLLASGAAALLGGCGIFVSSASFRYRMRVEGVVNGEAVYEILAEKVNGPRLPDEKPGGSIIKGEALVLETASGPVFLLLTSARSGGDLKGAVMRALAPDVPRSEEPYSYAVASRLSGAGEGEVKAELPRSEWPMMVRFTDINNPKSLEKVDPSEIGVKRIVLETTDASITNGIKKRLTWLGERGTIVSGSTINSALDETIYHKAFWQEY